jgi:hypothetical protein
MMQLLKTMVWQYEVSNQDPECALTVGLKKEKETVNSDGATIKDDSMAI